METIISGFFYKEYVKHSFMVYPCKIKHSFMVYPCKIKHDYLMLEYKYVMYA